jgi:hypothetical protein
MSIRTLTPRTVRNIQVTALSPTEWTVVDTQIASSEAASLIGFIEQVGDRFEVMQFGDPLKFLFFDTLDAATAHLSRRPVSAVPIHAA